MTYCCDDNDDNFRHIICMYIVLLFSFSFFCSHPDEQRLQWRRLDARNKSQKGEVLTRKQPDESVIFFSFAASVKREWWRKKQHTKKRFKLKKSSISEPKSFQKNLYRKKKFKWNKESEWLFSPSVTWVVNVFPFFLNELNSSAKSRFFEFDWHRRQAQPSPFHKRKIKTEHKLEMLGIVSWGRIMSARGEIRQRKLGGKWW